MGALALIFLSLLIKRRDKASFLWKNKWSRIRFLDE